MTILLSALLIVVCSYALYQERRLRLDRQGDEKPKRKRGSEDAGQSYCWVILPRSTTPFKAREWKSEDERRQFFTRFRRATNRYCEDLQSEDSDTCHVIHHVPDERPEPFSTSKSRK